MQARLRRLRADFDRVTGLFTEHPFVRVIATEGEPPEKYTFELRVSGLAEIGETEEVSVRIVIAPRCFCRSTILAGHRSHE